MEDSDHSKRRLFSALSWFVVGLYLILNIGVVISDSPISVLVVVIPLINITLITAWLFVRSLYNKANTRIKHRQYMHDKAAEQPIPKYGKGNGFDYIPDIKINSKIFVDLSSDPNDKAIFDLTMKDYLKIGRVINFHDEVDYGMVKKLKVSHVSMRESDIEVRFSQPEARDK